MQGGKYFAHHAYTTLEKAADPLWPAAFYCC